MNFNLFFKVIMCFLICLSPVASGGVFQCVNEKGSIEFRDSPCKTTLEKQEFLPIQYEKSNSKNIVKQQKVLVKNIKQQKIADRKQERKKLQTEKQKIKKEEKDKRREEHCFRVKEKIRILEDQLRAGHKLKSFNRLKTELEHFERMKQRYCVK